MVNLPINLDFLKFSSFFASLKAAYRQRWRAKVSPFAITGIRGAAWHAVYARAARVGRIPLACALLARRLGDRVMKRCVRAGALKRGFVRRVISEATVGDQL